MSWTHKWSINKNYLQYCASPRKCNFSTESHFNVHRSSSAPDLCQWNNPPINKGPERDWYTQFSHFRGHSVRSNGVLVRNAAMGRSSRRSIHFNFNTSQSEWVQSIRWERLRELNFMCPILNYISKSIYQNRTHTPAIHGIYLIFTPLPVRNTLFDIGMRHLFAWYMEWGRNFNRYFEKGESQS